MPPPAGPVLVDSSFYIAEMRAGRSPLRALRVVAEFRDLATCGVVCCEVGRGLREPERRAEFHRAWERMLYVPTDNRLWREVEETLWRLARAGRVIPLTDAVIAGSARRLGATVLTLDRHFAGLDGVRTAASVRELLLG